MSRACAAVSNALHETTTQFDVIKYSTQLVRDFLPVAFTSRFIFKPLTPVQGCQQTVDIPVTPNIPDFYSLLSSLAYASSLPPEAQLRLAQCWESRWDDQVDGVGENGIFWGPFFCFFLGPFGKLGVVVLVLYDAEDLII